MTQEIEILLNGISIVGSYAFIGGGLKYIDQVYDVGSFNKQIAKILSIFVGILMGLLIALDPASTIILLGIIISVGITRKINNLAFYLVTFFSVSIPVFLYFVPVVPDYKLQINLLPLILLVLSGIFDEFLDGVGDRKKIKIFTIRPFMKIMVLLLCIFGIFSYVYLLAFLAFDLAYIYVTWYSHKVAGVMSPLERRGRGVVLE